MTYRIRIGCPRRDLPKALATDPDWEWEFIDGSYVKAHQHNTGASDKELQAIGKSRADYTEKIHLVVDSYGLLNEFEVTGGKSMSSATPELLVRLPDAKVIVADKGFDRECIREQITIKGARVAIPRKRSSLKDNVEMDWSLCR